MAPEGDTQTCPREMRWYLTHCRFSSCCPVDTPAPSATTRTRLRQESHAGGSSRTRSRSPRMPRGENHGSSGQRSLTSHARSMPSIAPAAARPRRSWRRLVRQSAGLQCAASALFTSMVSICSSSNQAAAVRLRSSASSSTINKARRFCCACPIVAPPLSVSSRSTLNRRMSAARCAGSGVPDRCRPSLRAAARPRRSWRRSRPPISRVASAASALSTLDGVHLFVFEQAAAVRLRSSSGRSSTIK